MMKRFLSALALLALAAAGSAAQSGDRDLPPGMRSIAGVTLNRDSAASIRQKLGATRERKVGAGHDGFVSWCYVARPDSSPILLELMSDVSDMGTRGRELNVIRLRAASSAKARQGCTPLGSSVTLATPSGLRLGLTASQARALLGRPSRTTADSLVYDFDAKEYMRPDSPYYAGWNSAERRESCFGGGPPYANVGGTVILVLVAQQVAEIRLERYDQSVC